MEHITGRGAPLRQDVFELEPSAKWVEATLSNFCLDVVPQNVGFSFYVGTDFTVDVQF